MHAFLVISLGNSLNRKTNKGLFSTSAHGNKTQTEIFARFFGQLNIFDLIKVDDLSCRTWITGMRNAENGQEAPNKTGCITQCVGFESSCCKSMNMCCRVFSCSSYVLMEAEHRTPIFY